MAITLLVLICVRNEQLNGEGVGKPVRNYARLAQVAVPKARSSTPYLPLLLLPGGVQQQVPVPVILLGHVRVFLVDRIGGIGGHLGFDSCHGAASVRTSRSPSV